MFIRKHSRKISGHVYKNEFRNVTNIYLFIYWLLFQDKNIKNSNYFEIWKIINIIMHIHFLNNYDK